MTIYFTKNTKKLSAFSFLELSVVLLIISILLLGATTTSMAVLRKAKIKATQKRLDLIETALSNYLIENGRLPCPAGLRLKESDSSFAQEYSACENITANTETTCTNGVFLDIDHTNLLYGAVPAITLGLPKEAMKDAWDQKFGYAVDKRFATSTFQETDDDTIFKVYIEGLTKYLTQQAIYVLVSHGEDRQGGFSYSTGLPTDTVTSDSSDNESLNMTTAEELKNIVDPIKVADESIYPPCVPILTSETSFDNVFVYNVYSEEFDDLVRYKTKLSLVKEMEWKDVGCVYTKCDTTTQFITYGGSDNPYTDGSCTPDPSCTTCYKYGRSTRVTGGACP